MFVSQPSCTFNSLQMKDHEIFSMMIILLILITLSLDSVWILLGENCCWSLVRLKGLNQSTTVDYIVCFLAII